jgi:hypothetical protein
MRVTSTAHARGDEVVADAESPAPSLNFPPFMIAWRVGTGGGRPLVVQPERDDGDNDASVQEPDVGGPAACAGAGGMASASRRGSRF